MEAGDTLYFPAGMWHKVETLEPNSVSINISLMATNYATLVCQSLQHYLLQSPTTATRSHNGWRETIVNPPTVPNNKTNSNNDASDQSKSSTEVITKLQQLLSDLPAIIEEWRTAGAAHSMLPPVLQQAPAFLENSGENSIDNDDHDDGGDDDDDGENVSDHDESLVEMEKGENTMKQASHIGDSDNESRPSSSYDSAEDDGELVVDLHEFQGPPGWECPPPSLVKNMIKNPLASIMRMKDISRYYHQNNGNDGNNNDRRENELYVLNVSFAGNEAHESAVRVVLREAINDDDAVNSDSDRNCDGRRRRRGGLLEECVRCEEEGKDPVECFFRVANCDIPKCLVYYGYIHSKA